MTSPLVLAALISVAGCALVPVTRRTDGMVARRVDRVVAGPVGQLAIAGTSERDVLTIRVRFERMCTEYYTVTIEHRERTGAAIKSVNFDKIGRPDVMLLIAPAVVAGFGITALVTGIVVVAKRDTMERVEEANRRAVACALDGANVTVQATFPSGARVAALTDANGHARLVVPADEPDDGSVQLHARDRVLTIRYWRPRPARPFVDVDGEQPPRRALAP